MKIRTQFVINTAILGIILLLVSAAMLITDQSVKNTHQQEALATQIEREAYELGYLANDYLLHRESQQASRWEAKFASFSNDLLKMDVNTPEQQALLANIETNRQRLKGVFVEVRASIENAPQTQEPGSDAQFMQVSWSRLEVQSQGMIFDASRLTWLLREQEDQLRQVTSLLSFVLISMLGAFLWVNYGLTFRRTLKAIAELQAGTRVIGSGDLDFAIAVKNDDEIGELSRAFNQMTASLRMVTASKADLEKEISERKQAEEALRRNEALLLETGKLAKVGGWELDLETMQPTWTLETYHIHEVDPSLQPGLEGAIDFYAPEARPQISEAVRRAIEEGQSYDLELPLITAKGRNIWIRTMGQPEFRDGKCVRLFGTIQDITERKQAEVELIRLASFPERNPNPIVELGYSGDILYLNPKTRELFPDLASSGPKHPILADLEHVIPKFTEGKLQKHIIQEVKAGDAYYHQTIVNIPESKRIRLYNVDITERKQAEEALLAASLQKQASEYARSLIEVSIDPLVTISPEGKITDVNEATVKATGVPRQELIGTNFSSYFTEPEKAEQGYRQVFAQGFATDYPLTIRHRDGHLTDVLYNASLYKDAHGRILGAFAAARDVTVQKRAEAELKRHKENLEVLVKERTSELEESSRDLARSNENLEQFAYVASHDLQEPLRVMSSYSQLLERRYKGRLDQDADEFIDFIVEAAARMQKLITDLLAYSRAGHSTADMAGVDCNKIVRGLVDGMATTIESADGNVTFDRLPVITAHESSLTQLFQNLIGNALKFRGEQPPCIHVSARQAEEEWVFSVRDNGIGIEPQYSQRIFMIFQRLHPRDKYPGTGIGLSICKKIVDTLGGRIWVESEPGQGATFYFTAPIRKE
ncbi:MAG: PAS domain S-box protein [Chloroflexi bacterium]|nr:MAG: PAS domain S-box protein [Chloroflexota bacterium]